VTFGSVDEIQAAGHLNTSQSCVVELTGTLRKASIPALPSAVSAVTANGVDISWIPGSAEMAAWDSGRADRRARRHHADLPALAGHSIQSREQGTAGRAAVFAFLES
jgi:hypothetical protein